MHRALLLAALLVGLAACGTSAAATRARPAQIEFGVGGGNMVPFRVVISARGAVRVDGPRRVARKHLSRRTVLALDGRVRVAFRSGVESRECAGTNPDVGSAYVRLGGRTVTVHGSCEPGFQTLWSRLAAAVGLRLG